MKINSAIFFHPLDLIIRNQFSIQASKQHLRFRFLSKMLTCTKITHGILNKSLWRHQLLFSCVKILLFVIQWGWFHFFGLFH